MGETLLSMGSACAPVMLVNVDKMISGTVGLMRRDIAFIRLSAFAVLLGYGRGFNFDRVINNWGVKAMLILSPCAFC